MYFMYVDESGDPGRYNGSNTPHFILSGLLVKKNKRRNDVDEAK